MFCCFAEVKFSAISVGVERVKGLLKEKLVLVPYQALILLQLLQKAVPSSTDLPFVSLLNPKKFHTVLFVPGLAIWRSSGTSEVLRYLVFSLNQLLLAVVLAI